MYSAYLGYCASHLRLLFLLSSFFDVVLFSPGIHSGGEKKLTNNYLYIKQFLRDVVYIFCCHGHLKHSLKNYRFCRKSGNDAYSRGLGDSCYLHHYGAVHTKISMSLAHTLMQNSRK